MFVIYALLYMAKMWEAYPDLSVTDLFQDKSLLKGLGRPKISLHLWVNLSFGA